MTNWHVFGSRAAKLTKNSMRHVQSAVARALRHRWTTAIILQSPQARPSNLKSCGMSLVCAAVCALLLARMFDLGIQRNMDGDMYEAIGDVTHAVAVVISDMVYGLHKGYLAYRVVNDELERDGMTNRPDLIAKLGTTFPKNLRDRNLLNHAIAAAMSVEVPVHPSFGDRSLLSMATAELGIVDYYKLAFRLFGFRVEAAYYLYFGMLAVSLIAFLLAFYRYPPMLALPVLLLVAGNLLFATSFFDDINVLSVANPRFVSTLGLLPGLHIAMLVLIRRRPDWTQFALAMVQVAVFAFVVSIRVSILWFLIFIVALSVLQLGAALARRAAAADWSFYAGWMETTRLLRTGTWPAALLALGVWGYGLSIQLTMHPSYELDAFLPAHERFHNAFIGLEANPHWAEEHGRDYAYADSDTLGYLAGTVHMERSLDVPESFFISRLSNDYKMRLDDRMVRNEYLDFILRYPLFTIQAHLYKIKNLIVLLLGYSRQWLESTTALLLALGGLVVSVLTLVRFDSRNPVDLSIDRSTVVSITAVAVFAMLFSWIPIIYAYAAPHIIEDQLWMMMATTLVIAWAAAITAISFLLNGSQDHAPPTAA
jgi:hypothetical protein